MSEIKTQNAIIADATLGMDDRGFLTAWLRLDYDGFVQGFGGFSLYSSKPSEYYQLASLAGHFIYRVLEIADVHEWSELKGKTIRMKASHVRVEAIGHIINDSWFNPGDEFKSG